MDQSNHPPYTILRNLPGFSAKEKPFCKNEQKGLLKKAFLSSSKADRFE
ncbi:hypothetical protein BCBMB205_31130 [Bacillus sp. CN2]|nr:hypothetical protein BCBMB205_31130 [Bacillus velezensis]ARZ59458.1 hypothetical protein BAGQ_3253 [Bacillus velezensis]GFR54535.1 hypothetical protein BCBMB205_31130 [Bacillus sp. CN2]